MSNDIKQVGGTHYESDYQHWSWVSDINLGYLEGCATKYIARWRGKNGVQDVEKAITYLKKAQTGFRTKSKFDNEPLYINRSFLLDRNRVNQALKLTRRFCDINKIESYEATFMETVASWQNDGDLSIAIGFAQRILEDAKLAAEGQGSGAGSGATHKAQTPPQAAKTGAAGRAGGATTQPPASSASTGVHNTVTEGMEHPFGYDGDEE